METILFLVSLFVILCFVSRDWKTIKRVMGSWGIMELFNFLYDFPFWIWMQDHFGVIAGSVYASLGALVINFGFLVWYQTSGADWLGVNVFEQIKKEGEEWADKLCNRKGFFLKVALFVPVYLPAKIFKLVIWSLKKTELTTFLVFSVFADSFMTTVFMRRGRPGKLDSRDVKIFVVSTILSCVVWSIFNATLVETFQLLSVFWGNLFGW